MHITAMENGARFFQTYAGGKTGLRIVEIGAQDVNGSLRSVAPQGCEYVGIDFVQGRGVDIVLTDPYSLPLEDRSVDIVLASSVFEHSEFFWLLFNEMQRVLKPEGLCYLNVPSNADFHRYPVDCWRFYPDAGQALARWAQRSGYQTTLLESYVARQKGDVWNDFVAVYVKEPQFADLYPKRIQDGFKDFNNGMRLGRDGFENEAVKQEDQERRATDEPKAAERGLIGKLFG